MLNTAIKEFFMIRRCLSLSYLRLFWSGEPVGVGSVAGGGRYDNLVGMFDSKGRKVHFQQTLHIYEVDFP